MTDELVIEWPLASEVARALVEACRLEGDDPIVVAGGGISPRARVYAWAALCLRFPTVHPGDISVQVGARVRWSFCNGARSAVLGRTRNRWFDIERLNTVRRACGWPDVGASDLTDVGLVGAVTALRVRRREAAIAQAPSAPSAPAPAEIEPNPLPRFLDSFEPPEGAGAAVSSLTVYQCCWPLGDPSGPGFRYCAAPANPSDVPRYCALHAPMHAAGKGPLKRLEAAQ